MTDYEASEQRYDQMRYRRAGRSGLLLPALSLGLWHNFGTDRGFDGQRAIVRRAFDLGVTHFDLANNYGPPYGAAETTFGRILASDLHPYRDEIVVSTKAGYDMWAGPYGDHGSRKSLLASLDQSLHRLGIDYVDIFYSHRPDPATPLEETMGALVTAVRSGKALYAAISNYDPDQTRAAETVLRGEGIPLLLHQPPYSMLDRRPEHGLLDLLDELGVGSIVFSPLAQGLLTDRYRSGVIPGDSRAATSRYLDSNQVDARHLRRLERLGTIADRRDQSIAQLALNWVLRGTVTSAIIGASSPSQLEQNLAALDAPPLESDDLAEIDTILRAE